MKFNSIARLIIGRSGGSSDELATKLLGLNLKENTTKALTILSGVNQIILSVKGICLRINSSRRIRA